MCVPFAVSGILLFSVPVSWASTPKLIYVFITYNLVSTVIYNTFTLPLVEYFGNNNSAWTKTFCVFGVLAVAAFLINFFGIKERVKSVASESGKTEEVPFAVGVKALFQNKYWIMMTAMLVKKYGKRNVFALGLIFGIIGMTVLNFSGGAMGLIIVSNVIRGIGNGIGSALLGLILELGGYVGEAAAQSASALVSIRVCFVWIPIVVYAIGLVMMKFYHLDEEFAGIMEELQILIDLHTAPMGQNGFDNGGICGVCKWSQCPEEVEFVLFVLERLAEHYGTRKGLWGIEVLNEPMNQGSGYFYWSYKLLTDTVNSNGWIGWDSRDFGRCAAFDWFPIEKECE